MRRLQYDPSLGFTITSRVDSNRNITSRDQAIQATQVGTRQIGKSKIYDHSFGCPSIGRAYSRIHLVCDRLLCSAPSAGPGTAVSGGRESRISRSDTAPKQLFTILLSCFRVYEE